MADFVSVEATIVSSKTPHFSPYLLQALNSNFVDKAFEGGGSIAYGTIEASKVGLVVHLWVIVSWDLLLGCSGSMDWHESNLFLRFAKFVKLV